MRPLVGIRNYKDGDEKGIIPLFNQVFEAEREEEYWHWQFMQNPAMEPIIIVADDDSKIVGQSTLLPTEVVVIDRETYAGQSIDTMVDPDYRRQGLYENMAFKSYDIAIEEGVEFGFRFPSKPALEGAIKKLDGTLVEEIPLYMKIYSLENFIKSIIKIGFISKILGGFTSLLMNGLFFREKRMKSQGTYVIKEIEEFNEEFDSLWDKVKEDKLIMTKRSSRFLNWRIKNHPNIDYKTFAAYSQGDLVGYIVVKIEERKLRGKYKSYLGSIVDMVGLNEEVISVLYREAKIYFKRKKTDFVVVWGSESMKYKDLFIRLGFFKSKSTIPFVVKDFTKDRELEDIIINEKSWYLMPIESDFY